MLATDWGIDKVLDFRRLPRHTAAVRKRVHIALAGLLAAVLIGVIGWQIPRVREPVYQGKRLRVWLKQLDSGLPTEAVLTQFHHGPDEQSPQQEQAVRAVRQLGTNGLPYLVHTLTNVDSTVRSSICDFLWRHSIRFSFPSGSDHRQGAALGLAALGPAAKSVTPDLGNALIRTNQSREYYYDVALALGGICPDGQAVLAQALLSTNLSIPSDARMASAQALVTYRAPLPELLDMDRLIAAATNDVSTAPFFIWLMRELGQPSKTLVPFLVREVRAPLMNTRTAAIESLGRLGQEGELVIPVLSAELQSTNAQERLAAVNALGELVQQNEVAMPPLTRALQSTNGEERLAAINALGKLAQHSELAMPPLMGTLQSTNAEDQLAAVRALAKLGSRARSAVPTLLSAVQEAEKQEGRDLLPQLLDWRTRSHFLGIPWAVTGRVYSREEIVATIVEGLNQIDPQWTNSLSPDLVTGPTPERWQALGKGVETHCQGLSLAECVVLSRGPEPQYQGRTLREWLRQPTESLRQPADTWSGFGAVREGSEHAMMAIGTNGIPWLVVWLQSPDWEGTLLSRRGFDMLKKEGLSALPALVELAQSNSESIRDPAYGCITRIKPGWATLWPALIPVLHSPDAKVRMEAATVLYRLFPEEAKQAGVYYLIPPIPQQ